MSVVLLTKIFFSSVSLVHCFAFSGLLNLQYTCTCSLSFCLFSELAHLIILFFFDFSWYRLSSGWGGRVVATTTGPGVLCEVAGYREKHNKEIRTRETPTHTHHTRVQVREEIKSNKFNLFVLGN